MFSATELVWPKGTLGGELALTTACNPRHSYSSIWGLCSSARCRRRTSECQARSRPSSSASHWLCQPTRCKGCHLWERGKTPWSGLSLTTLMSTVHLHPQRQCWALVDWTSRYPLTSKCISIKGIFKKKIQQGKKNTTGNGKPTFPHQDRYLFPWKKLRHSSFTNLGVYSEERLARWGQPWWRHVVGALTL